jgi:hypothetical protein
MVRFVRFALSTVKSYLVVPEQVVYLQELGALNQTVIHLTSGESIKVDGSADEVARRLQGH